MATEAGTGSKTDQIPDSYANPKIAGVILAAGHSRRMGQPKLLMPYRGEALIRWPTQAAVGAGLYPVVVLGAYAEKVRDVLSDLPVHFVPNPEWESGQSTSVKVGIRALPLEVEGALFLLGDQPGVSVDLLLGLVGLFEQHSGQIIAPMTAGKQGNPVLFGRSLFPELLTLTGDAGGRQLFSTHPVVHLPWDIPEQFLDIDTPEDYEHLIGGVEDTK